MPEIFGLREYHEFELDEYLEESSSPAQGEGFIKPFDVDVGVDLYVRHLPLKQDDEQLHPWRDAVWQDPDWMWGSTRLSAREAMFWFMATTLPERHQDTQLAPKGAEILRRLDLGALLEEMTVAQAAQRMRSWFEEVMRRRGQVRWFTYAYMSRLLTEIFPAHELLELLFSVIPGAEVRHFFTHIRVEEDVLQGDEAMRANISSHVQMIPVERSEEDAYVAVRLLEKFPVEEAAVALCERLEALSDRSGFLVRDAVRLLRTQENFIFWFNKMADYHIAREAIPSIVLRGGMEVVHELTLRVVQHPDAFLSVAFKDLLRLHTWRAVDGMLLLTKRKPFGRAARDWLVSNAVHTVYRLLPLWLSGASAGEDRALIQELLEEICARGQANVLEQFTAECSEEDRARIQDAFGDYELEII